MPYKRDKLSAEEIAAITEWINAGATYDRPLDKSKQQEWWSAGSVPLLELQAGNDPFMPPEKRSELRDEFGARVTTVLIPDAGHALLPEQPKAVVAAIVGWVRKLKPSS